MDAFQRTRRLVGHWTRRYTFQRTLPPRLSDHILGVEEGSGGMGSGGMTTSGARPRSQSPHILRAVSARAPNDHTAHRAAIRAYYLRK